MLLLVLLSLLLFPVVIRWANVWPMSRSVAPYARLTTPHLEVWVYGDGEVTVTKDVSFPPF